MTRSSSKSNHQESKDQLTVSRATHCGDARVFNADETIGMLEVTIWDAAVKTQIRLNQCGTTRFRSNLLHDHLQVIELKEMILSQTGYPLSAQRLFVNNAELRDDQTLSKATQHVKSGSIIDATLRLKTIDEAGEVPQTSIQIFGTLPSNDEMDACMARIGDGFRAGKSPQLSSDGTSGVYFLRDSASDEIVSVFKPIDEEPFAPNNPRDMKAPFGSETCRPGVKSGEANLREVIAYLLDHDGFSNVPATALVETLHPSFTSSPISESQVASQESLDLISGLLSLKKSDQITSQEITSVQNEDFLTKSQNQSEKFSENENQTLNSEEQPIEIQAVPTQAKIGSLQRFVQSKGPIENFSSDLFSADEIHKIAVLDMRLLNLDRNECNILVQEVKSDSGEATMRLIPIDHGMTLPDSLEVCSYDLAWLSYSQSEKAFSQETLDFIAGLDIDYDISHIEKNFKVRPICLRNMKISSLLLKKAAAAGLNLAQIGEILCRPDEDDTMPSILEKIVSEAETRATQELDDLQQDINFALQQFQEERRVQNKRRFPDITVDQADDFPIRSRLHKSDSFENKSPLKIALESSLGASTNGAPKRARGLTEEEGDEAEQFLRPSNLKKSAGTNLLGCFENSEEALSDLSIAIEVFPDQEEASSNESSKKIEDVEAGTNGPHDNVFFKYFNALLSHALAAYKQDGCCKAFMEGPKMSSAASVTSTAASEMSFLSTSFTK